MINLHLELDFDSENYHRLCEFLDAKNIKHCVQKPVLKQHDVKRSVPPYDGELLRKLWYERNPQHETNADSGEDMFWRTAFMVMADYMQLAGGNDA